jgi:hypothetical protein
MQSVFVWIRCVYLVNGESDAPAGEEQRAPANGWCDLETLLADDLEGKNCRFVLRAEASLSECIRRWEENLTS